MTPETAFDLLRQAAERFVGTKQDHDNLSLALQVVKATIERLSQKTADKTDE